MERRDIFWGAWETLKQFDVFVSVPHGAVLPDEWEGTVKLNFGAKLPTPIKDLKFDETGLYATMLFKGEDFECFIPPEAIAGICTSDYMVSWPIVAKSNKPEPEAKADTVEARAKKAGLRLL